MRCPEPADLAAHVDGELSRNDEARLLSHVETCGRCEHELAGYRDLVGALAAPPSIPGDDPAAIARRALAAAPAPSGTRAARPRWRRARWAAAGATIAAAAAAIVLLVVTQAPAGDDRGERGFQARGGGVTDPTAWAGVRLFRTTGPATAEPVGAAISPSDALLVGYDNGGPAPFAYLMVYAIDAAGAVHWYHPPYRTVTEDPFSIAIEAGAGHELAEAVSHPLPRGRLRVVGLFSRAPLRVRDVDAAPLLDPPGAVRVVRELDVR